MRNIAGKVHPDSPGTIGDVPPHLYFIGSALFHYLGPSFAVLLFAHVAVSGVAWLRIVSAGIILAIWRRPWGVFRTSPPRACGWIFTLGAVIAVMNYAFYMAIARLPLGTVAAIEFLGPLALALFGTRSGRNAVALVLVIAGVYVLTGIHFVGSPRAMVWAYLDAFLFAAYIVAAHAVSRSGGDRTSVDGLAAAMVVACVVITPLGLSGAVPAMRHPMLLGAGVGVGVSSSVIPYVFDQLAMRKLARATYALFVAILPATAVLVGAVVLRQIPTLAESFAVGLVVLAVLIHQESAPLHEKPPAVMAESGHQQHAQAPQTAGEPTRS